MKNPVVSLSRRAYFSAARQLSQPDYTLQQNREIFGLDALPHGHDYTLDIFYSGPVGAQDGMIVNISEIKPILAEVLSRFDGKHLSREVEALRGIPATLENLVSFLWTQFPARLGTGHLSRLRLQETARLWADKTPDSMRITRSYEFAAAHRLHAPYLSDAENDALYGKCNNPLGHGHNFGLEVTLEGTLDSQSGALISQRELDKIVDKEVFERFDHKHLNEDCPEFKGMIPTTENLTRVIFEVLRPKLEGPNRRLAKIGLHETQKNYFEVEA